MQKPYSLLRNNKQSGPYSLEELLHLTLKPFDLVWVDGKSGGWHYPTEIDVLKQHVTKPKKEKKNLDAEKVDDLDATQKEITPAPPTSSRETEVAIREVSTHPKKTNHIYIRLPASFKLSESVGATIAPVEETPEEKLERKAQALREKIQAFTETENRPKADNDLDTKYARSLDDIKEEYTSWLHTQKKKKKLSSGKLLLIIPVIALLFVAGYFMLFQFKNEKVIQESRISAQEIKASVPVFNEANNNKIVAQKKAADSKMAEPSSQKMKTDKTISLPLKKGASNSSGNINSSSDSLIMADKKPQPREEAIRTEPKVNKQEGSRQKTVMETEEPAIIEPINKNEANSTNFTELIKLSESTGSGTPHLSLYNNSAKHINFVAIDVFYYGANQKLLQKKTLYFNDISPLSSSKLFIPQAKKAVSVNYQMGLISAEGGLYYAKQ